MNNIGINIEIRPNLYLRSLNENDATETYYSWLNDTDVNKYLSTKSATVEELKEYINDNNKSTNKILLGIFMGHTHIGNTKLEVDLDNKRAIFSIMIGSKESWNLGIGTEVTKKVCDYAFDKIGLKNIELGVLDSNLGAIKAYKKAGFVIVDSGLSPAFDNSKDVVMRIERYPKVWAIIQARMGSTRLPGKAMLPIGKRTAIGHVFNRVKKAKTVDHVVLATGKDSINDPLEVEANKYDIPTFRGDDDWLLNRYVDCVCDCHAETIIRITGDCVLVDPDIIDKVVTLFNESGADYASNVHPPTYPDGFDVEVFSKEALFDVSRRANIDSDREHATPYLWKKKGFFKHASLENDVDLNEMRVVLDYKRDLEILRQLEGEVDFETAGVNEIVEAYRRLDIEQYAVRNEGYALSLQNDTDSYKKSLSNSEALIERAKKVIPCSAQTYSKSYRHFAYPVFLREGSGSHVWDVDGNEYIDFNCGLGAVSLGYGYKFFNTSCRSATISGISFSQPHPIEVELAEKIIDIIPSAEMVKFMKNGSDVTTAAVRLARAHTGRDVVAKCGYHGFHDWSIGVTSNNAGIPKCVSDLTIEFEYNNIDSLKKILENHKVAAVIMEPLQHNGPIDGFLRDVRGLCDTHEVVLIFDEVLSGFRTALGGAQAYYGVTPDLSTFGKAVSNGFPLSILVGKSEIMKQIDDGVFISTTFGGDIVSLSAALYTINEMEATNGYDKMISLGNMWKDNVNSLIKEYEIEGVEVVGHPSHCGLVFDSVDTLSFYQQFMAEQGILTLGINNFCLSHTERDIMNFIRALDEALYAIKELQELEFYRDYRIRPVFKR